MPIHGGFLHVLHICVFNILSIAAGGSHKCSPYGFPNGFPYGFPE
jgi:hypothetical protein